jgi:general secretion pathway protein B
MSYILDALKKAEAERQIGGVPSIHAATAGASVQPEETPFLRGALPWLITGLLALAMLAYLLWSHPWSRNEPAPAVPAPVPAQPAPAVANEPAPVPQPTAVPEAPAPAAPVHQAAPVPEKPIRSVSPPVAALEKIKVEGAKPVVPAPATAASTTSTAAAATPTPEEEAGTIRDLPEAIQRELPPVTITGYLYARNPADRSALINKKLLHEGESVAPDLVLEKLTPKGAVLNYKGYRYRISY